jgi:hypothetical protein
MKRSDDWDDDERAALDEVRDEIRALQDRHRGDPPLDLLRAARAEALPDTLSDAATDHLASSAWSRALVEGADGVDTPIDLVAEDRILSRVRAKVRQEQPARRRFRVWLWAPALSAAVIVLAMLVLRRSGTSEPVALAPAQAPAATPSPATAAAPAPSSVFHLPFDKPEVRFTATALVLRGAGGGPRFVDVVAPAVRAYRAGEYGTAAREFASLQPRYSNSVEVFFYLGVSRLFLGDAEGGRVALEGARRLSDDAFGPSVDWYLAIADERGGHVSEARAALDRLCGGSSEYHDRACDGATHIAPK